MRQDGITMGLATVYRSLDALKLEGAVQMRTLPSGESVYSLPLEDRHHLTCLQCGNTIAIDECPVHELEEQLHKSHHFRIFLSTPWNFLACAPNVRTAYRRLSEPRDLFSPFHPGRDLPAGKPAPVEGYPASTAGPGASHQHQPVKRFQAGSLKMS